MIPTYDFITALKFASHAMGKNDVRYYLNGVLFRFVGNDLVLTGSDGHRVAEVHLQLLSPTNLYGDYIVKGDSVKELLRTVKTRQTDDSTVELSDSRGEFRFVSENDALTLELHDARYPDLRRVYPTGDPDGAPMVGLNADYLAQAASALKTLSNRKYNGIKMELFGDNGNRPARLTAATGHGQFRTITEPAVVHIMPMRL